MDNYTPKYETQAVNKSIKDSDNYLCQKKEIKKMIFEELFDDDSKEKEKLKNLNFNKEYELYLNGIPNCSRI